MITTRINGFGSADPPEYHGRKTLKPQHSKYYK